MPDNSNITRGDVTSLVDSIRSAVAKNEISFLMPFRLSTDGLNQLVFFLKPECFAHEDPHIQNKVLMTILARAERAGLRVHGAVAITGAWLRDHRVMDRHYGYINQLSRAASRILSDDDRREIASRVGWTGDATSANMMGGHEFLERFPDFDAVRLDAFWQSKKSIKLRGGLYVQRFERNGEEFVLVNGFHPQQLAHYTADDRRIVVMLCDSDANWSDLRDNLIGDTFPERAVPGSIRGTLWKERADLSLTDISVAYNYVHLSAGPFEGAHEIRNFLGTQLVKDFEMSSTTLAKAMMRSGLDSALLEKALANPHVTSGKDLFGATENLNTPDAVEFFRSENDRGALS